MAAALTEHCSQSQISHAEAGRVGLSAEKWTQIAQELEVSLDYLAGLTDEPTPVAQLVPALASTRQEADLVALRDVRAAAGWKSRVEAEPVIGHMAFPRRWMRRHGLRPERCSVIEVMGDSMEPLLGDGCWILVDHARSALLAGRVFAIWTGESLVVKRVSRAGGRWLLASDNASFEPFQLPRHSRVVGEVRWAMRPV